ncbi:UPF0262 family protein (plasmid) [Sinorhizobium meliloti]
MKAATTSPSNFRLCAVSLDESFGSQAEKVEKREQAVAIFDLLDNNTFAPVGHVALENIRILKRERIVE